MAKDKKPTVWWADNGQRFGTYVGHDGAVMQVRIIPYFTSGATHHAPPIPRIPISPICFSSPPPPFPPPPHPRRHLPPDCPLQCAVKADSSRLLTSSADSTVRLWNVTSGEEYYKWEFHAPSRSVSLSLGEELAVTTQDQFMQRKAQISVLKLAEDPHDQGTGVYANPIQTIEMTNVAGRHITRAAFSPANDTILTCHDDGHIRRWDTETGKLLADKKIHDKIINDMRFSNDYTHFITASTDGRGRIVDTETLEVLKTYETQRPCNSAAICPIHDHVVVCGGQDAASVTTTTARSGKFESLFYHKIYEEEFGQVRGHFGPVNSVCYSPDGKKFVTGGEDGYVRLATFDSDYHTTKFF